jgi:hypothetical protein
MEQKTLKSNDFIKLLIHSLKQKKNWFLISTVIIFVTTLLIPYILRFSENSFLVFGIVEIFIIVFLNCLIDNSFLHNDSKLAYYKSKPISFEKKILVEITTNIIFTFFLIILLSLSIGFHQASNEYAEILKLIIPWLVVGVFLTSLSSILTGNTIVAGIMTIFNFSLPALFYLIILFVFTILEDIVIGFNANILMDTLTNTFYRLDYLYFYEFINKPIDLIYIFELIIILVVISLIIKICLKRRKNENTGDFIVFDGFKYFVSVIAGIIIPATFSMILYNVGVTSKIIVSLLLAMLTYYIIIAILEKSFKISLYSIKLFAGCMAVFMVLTGGTVLFAQQFKNTVPNPKDVKMAYIGNNSWVFSRYLYDNDNYRSEDYENPLDFARKNGITIFTDERSIELVTELHHEMLSDQTYFNGDYYTSNIVISYLMNDGNTIIRDYKLEYNFSPSEGEGTKRKNNIANKIINLDEVKERQYYYLYDESFYKGKDIYYIVKNIRDNNIKTKSSNIDEIRQYLIKDIDNMLLIKEDAFEYLIYGGNLYPYYKDEDDTNIFYMEIIENGNGTGTEDNILDEISIDNNFKNTMEYLRLNN